MTGVPGGICNASITNEVDSIYTSDNAVCTSSTKPWSCCSGAGTGSCPAATPNLFSLIASTESSYTQFGYTTANGLDGQWPKESATVPAGKYVGLMQVALQMAQGNTYASPMDTAWNWLTNVQIADDIFSQKLGYIGVIEKNAMNSHPGLQALDGYDAENMALLQYGGFASPTLPSVQYYVVLKVSGIWEWVQNPHASTKGQAYVTKVRNATPPNSTTCN